MKKLYIGLTILILGTAIFASGRYDYSNSTDVTVTDSNSIDLTLSGQNLAADVNETWLASQAAADPNSHDAVTVTQSSTITLTLTGQDVTADANETGIEAILDLQDLQGAVTDAQVPDNITASLYLDLATYDPGGDYVDGDDTAYDITTWDGDVNTPSKNVVRDILALIDTDGDGDVDNVDSGLFLSQTDANSYIMDVIESDPNVMASGISFVITDGNDAVDAGTQIWMPVPFDCNITQVTALADQSGSIVVDLWVCTYAEFDMSSHPVDGDSITSAAPITISTAIKSQDSTLTDWTVALSAGDILLANVDSCTSIEKCTISLDLLRY